MKFWIARDSNGELWIYDHKPLKNKDIFESDLNLEKCIASELPSLLFPEVTFWNSPREVEIKLVNDGISN